MNPAGSGPDGTVNGEALSERRPQRETRMRIVWILAIMIGTGAGLLIVRSASIVWELTVSAGVLEVLEFALVLFLSAVGGAAFCGGVAFQILRAWVDRPRAGHCVD